MSDDIVVVDDVVKEIRPGLGQRPRRVLDGISFRVQRGEIFGFVGPNGAGKTTTLKVLMGLIRPTSGRASILGHDIRESAFRRHVGFLPENPWFYDFLTGREFLRFYARVSGVSSAERGPRIETLLGRVGLAAAGDARLRTYSKGMLQRIGIAQALVHDPSVVFLDEPMSGLDPIGRKEIRDLILQLHGEGKTIFMNTHILSDVEMVCDRVAIIVKGRIRYEGRIEAFLGDHQRLCDVVLAGVSPDLVERFEEGLGAEVRGRGEQIEFRVRDKSVDELLRTALDAGAEVRSVTPHRVSLESVFLSAVENGERADADPVGPAGEGGAMISAQRIAAVAENTVREAVRSRVLYVLVFFALVLIGTGVLLSTLSYVERERILQDVGLGAIRLFGAAIAVFIGVGLIHREVDRRTIYTVLSKPVSRSEFLLGKYLGLLATLWIQVAIMGVGFVVVSLLADAPLHGGHAAAIGLAAVELAVLVAVATLFSAFTTPLLASLFSVGLYAVGHLSRDLRELGAASGSPSAEQFTAALYRLLPDLERFNLTVQAAHDLPITPAETWMPVVYGLAWVGLLLTLASVIFERRDFR